MTFTAGQKIRASQLNEQGVCVARGRRTTGPGRTTTTTRTSAKKVIEVGASLIAGRCYEVKCPNVGVFSAAAGRIGLQINYTINNTTPGPASTALCFTQVDTPTSDQVIKTDVGDIYVPGSAQTFRAVLSFWAVNAGDYGVFAASDWATNLLIVDMGPDPGDSGVDF